MEILIEKQNSSTHPYPLEKQAVIKQGCREYKKVGESYGNTLNLTDRFSRILGVVGMVAAGILGLGIPFAFNDFTQRITTWSKEIKTGKEVTIHCISLRKATLAGVAQNGYELKNASKALKNDKEVVLAAVNQNGWSLRFASTALKNNKEVVLAAVRQNGLAIQLASKELRNDLDVVKAAVTQNAEALFFASAALKNNKSLALQALRDNGNAYYWISTQLKSDPEIIAAAKAATRHIMA